MIPYARTILPCPHADVGSVLTRAGGFTSSALELVRSKTMSSTDVACTLSSLDLGRRKQALQQNLLPHIVRRRLLDDGLAVALPSARRSDADAFVAFESECCAFADFSVHEDGDLVWIRVTATTPDGIAAVRSTFGAIDPSRTSRRLRIAGILSGSAGLLALACCVAPALAVGIGAGVWLDGVGAALLIGGGGLFVGSVVHRRRCAC